MRRVQAPHRARALFRRRARDHLPVVVHPVAVVFVHAFVAPEHVRAPVRVVVLVQAECFGDGHVLGLTEVRYRLFRESFGDEDASFDGDFAVHGIDDLAPSRRRREPAFSGDVLDDWCDVPQVGDLEGGSLDAVDPERAVERGASRVRYLAAVLGEDVLHAGLDGGLRGVIVQVVVVIRGERGERGGVREERGERQDVAAALNGRRGGRRLIARRLVGGTLGMNLRDDRVGPRRPRRGRGRAGAGG